MSDDKIVSLHDVTAFDDGDGGDGGMNMSLPFLVAQIIESGRSFNLEYTRVGSVTTAHIEVVADENKD